MHRRLKKLEYTSGTNLENKVTVIFRNIVAPSASGPERLGIGVVSIVRGGTFLRSDYPDDHAFKDALDNTHTELHGKPIEWDGTERFYARGQ